MSPQRLQRQFEADTGSNVRGPSHPDLSVARERVDRNDASASSVEFAPEA